MRIVGGAWRGLRLAAVGKGDAAAHLRPTSDRVREALFNVLTNGAGGDVVADAVVLDLFAGTGALGLEALSRGARHATFVDSGRAAQALIAENITKARAEDRTTRLKTRAERLPVATRPATLIFLDPPYGKAMGEAALPDVENRGWIAPQATIVWEEATEMASPDGFIKTDARQFGTTWITFLRYVG